MRKKFFQKKKVKKLDSELVQFIKENSTIRPTGKVTIFEKYGKKNKVHNIDYFAPKPTDEILKEFVMMVMKGSKGEITNYYFTAATNE